MHALSEYSFSLYGYLFLVFLVAIQRLAELRVSMRHEKTLKEQGAIEMYPRHFLFMKLLHSLWLVACFVEALTVKTPPPLWVSLLWFIVFCVGQYLRWQAMKTLGTRWTVRILVLPQRSPVTQGPYRFIRHPNYLGVVLEILSLPLIFGLYFTSLFFTLGNAVILWVRIRAEESALNRDGLYDKAFKKDQQKEIHHAN